jgi:predicted nucleic acid-binding protein
MILVDTSVWIDHLRSGSPALVKLLEDQGVLTHPFVVGELACGSIRGRAEFLHLLGSLPQAAMATDDEVLHFIENHSLMGRGIGYVGAHLLASVALTHSARLETGDTRLAAVAARLGLKA